MEHDRDVEKEYILEDIIRDDEDVTSLYLNPSGEGDEQNRGDGSGDKQDQRDGSGEGEGDGEAVGEADGDGEAAPSRTRASSRKRLLMTRRTPPS